MGTVLRGLGARGLAACALLLLPRAPRGAYAEAHPPWPVAVHANGSVSVSADQGGIHLVPKEGHAVEVRGSLEVGGTDVYVLLQPPACDGAHQKLQHNGTAWLCVCESGWAGEGCAESVGTEVCASLAGLFSFELELETSDFTAESTLLGPPLVRATGLPWSESAFGVESVSSSNTSVLTAAWLPDQNKVQVNKSSAALAALEATLDATLTFFGRMDMLANRTCELSAGVRALPPAPPPSPPPSPPAAGSQCQGWQSAYGWVTCAYIQEVGQCWCKGSAQVARTYEVCGYPSADYADTGPFYILSCTDTYLQPLGFSGYQCGDQNSLYQVAFVGYNGFYSIDVWSGSGGTPWGNYYGLPQVYHVTRCVNME